MIFAFLLLLQVVQYNVQGKHFQVEMEDGNSLEENGPGQVYEYFSILSGAGGGGWKTPPSHTFAIPRKKLMGKVANFFYFSQIWDWKVRNYFLQSDNIQCGREGPKVVKYASIS